MTGPRLSPRRSTAAEEIRSVGSLGLPADILAESMRRLQAATLLYAGGLDRRPRGPMVGYAPSSAGG
jgi:hypothetical protein